MAKKRSALRKQRPLKRKKQLSFKVLATCLAILVCVGLGWTAVDWTAEYLSRPSAVEPIDWQMEISGKPLSAREQEAISRLVQDMCPRGTQAELKFAAKILQTKLEVQQVKIARSNTRTLNIIIKPRTAFMRIDTGKSRLLTGNGQIYGVSQSNDNKLPILTGIPISAAAWRSDGTLKISPSSQTLVKNAIELVQLADRDGFSVKTVEYVPHRGFALTRSEDDIIVVVGNPPYAEKLHRLSALIDGLKKKGSLVERIELDYQGKAFVKEKKKS